MKKLFMLIWVTLGLAGLVTAQADNTWITPQPLKDYLYDNTPMTASAFFNLDTAYTDNGGQIDLKAAAQAYGIQSLIPLGGDLADGTALNDVFFGYDNGAWVTATRTGANSKINAFPIGNLAGNTSFSFMEKDVTGFIISAAGGVYFTDQTNGNAEMTLPDPLAYLKAQSVQYAARGFIAKYSNGKEGQYAAIMNSVPITKMTNKPVGYIALCKDNISGLMYLLVQYNLSVNGHALVYQIKMADDGRVEYRIGRQDYTAKTEEDDDYYTFRIDLKRTTDTISFGSNSVYAISPLKEDTDKTAWVITANTAMQNRVLSIYPQGGAFTGTSVYTSINATMTLSAKSKEALSNATGMLVFATPKTIASPQFANQAYAVGDYVKMAQNDRDPGYLVVYNGKPADLGNISFTVYGLSPNVQYYLYAYLYKVDGNDYHYANDIFVSSDAIRTAPMETPTDLTVGEAVGDNIPLSFSASPFKLLIMKSESAYSNNPQGILKEGDTYGEGTVVTILEKGVTTCNIPMAPGEMTYLQLYAMDDNTTVPGYSTNFTLEPLYRQADRLPLSYTFGDKDFVVNQPENAMPILPPGLSTSTAFDGDRRLEAFVIEAPNHMESLTKYLTATSYSDNWSNVIMPAVSGVVQIQATFNVKFYKWAMVGHSEASPAANDSIRIEYRLNGGAWRTAGQFSGANMPETFEGCYPLSVSITCRANDVVNLRYSCHSELNTKNAIVSYEFIDASDCEMPTNLKAVSEKMTDKAVVLTWKDNNNPAAGQYRVSYQKYVAPASDDEDETLPDETEDEDLWETLTVNATTAKLQHLEGNTTYNVKVQAICASGESIASTPVQVTAPLGLPYMENMTFADGNKLTNRYAVTPDVTVYKGEPGIEEQADYLQSIEDTPDSWNALQCEANILDKDPDALAVSTAQDEAMLVTPVIFLHPYVTPLPKTLTFKVNTYAITDDGAENGVDLLDEDLRLYVLATTDETFSWDDTVASFDHNALKAAAVTAADENGYADRGKALSVKMDPFEGLARIAFYFHNPNIFNYYAPENDGKLPMFLEILNIALDYDGEVPCFPIEDLKATNVNVSGATLTWEGEGEEYGITYYPVSDKTQAKTVYQDATDTDLQTLKLEGLETNINYMAEVVSYCTKGDRENGSIAVSVRFRTLRELFELAVNITPDNAGTVTGTGSYFDGSNVTLTATPQKGYKFVAWKDGDTELSNEVTYKFKMPAKNITYTAVFTPLETFRVLVSITPQNAGMVLGAGLHLEGDTVTLSARPNTTYKFVAWKDGDTELSQKATYSFTMPGHEVSYTAVFESLTANEDEVRAHFGVNADNGQLIIRNLNGLTIKDVEVFGLTGTRLQRFTPNSRENLMLPLNTAHTLIVVRLHTEKGTAVYKVYVN